MNVLYLYSGTRKGKWQGTPGVDFPDTQLYGLNHLDKYGISAEHKELSDILPQWIVRFIPFRLRHMFLYFVTKKYDVVFGSSLLYLLIFQKIFRRNTKFILLNISVSRTISVNKTRKIRMALIRSLAKELSAVVCLSNTQKKFIEENLPFLEGNVYTVPLGVDVVYHTPVYEGRKQYILSAGRDNGRDYKTVIEVARLLPDREFHIVCSRRNLEGVEGIPENVHVFFDISPDDLYEKYKEAQMLLLVTHDDAHADGSDCSGQTVLLEAMANGLPVIASKKDYLRDYIADHEDVLLVNNYDPSDIMEKIKILDSGEERELIAHKARKKVEEHFSTREMARQLSDVFMKLKRN